MQIGPLVTPGDTKNWATVSTNNNNKYAIKLEGVE